MWIISECYCSFVLLQSYQRQIIHKNRITLPHSATLFNTPQHTSGEMHLLTADANHELGNMLLVTCPPENSKILDEVLKLLWKAQIVRLHTLGASHPHTLVSLSLTPPLPPLFGFSTSFMFDLYWCLHTYVNMYTHKWLYIYSYMHRGEACMRVCVRAW